MERATLDAELWRSRLQRIAVVLCGALAMGASCSDESAPQRANDATQPLPQQSVVMLEVDVANVGWVAMPVPQEGAERLARLWCWHDRMKSSDTKLCGRTLVGGTDPLAQFDPGTLGSVTTAECQIDTCLLRNEVCAGMLLEEAARSPLPRTLESSTVGAQFDLGDALLGVKDNVRKTALVAAGARDTVRRTQRIRFQPMRAASRAAALRGALNRYRDAGVMGEALTERQTRTGAQSCLDLFAPAEGAEALQTTLTADGDGRIPTWADVLYLGITDAASEYSGTLYRTVDAMRDSAATVRNGSHDQLAEVATQWNGEVDSAVAIAKLLGYGDEDAPVSSQALALSDCGAPPKASDIGPTGVPVCPPISDDEGAKNAEQLFVTLLLAPDAVDPVGKVVNKANVNWMKQGLIQAPMGQKATLDALGVTETSVKKGAAHLCQKARLTGTFLTQTGSVSAGGLVAPVYAGVVKPQGSLPAAVLTSHFVGAVGAESASKLGSPSYAKAGAIRTLDMLKKTTNKLGNSPAGGSVSPKLVQAVASVAKGLAADTGGRRLEFVLGSAIGTADGVAVDHLGVVIHGVPADGAGEAGEKYWLVQGLDGLKCAVFGSIDNAECTLSDWLVDLNAVGTYTTAPDPRMTDLGGGFLRASFDDLPAENKPHRAILVEQGVYVIRVEAGKPVAFGGVVPTPGTLVIGSAVDFPWPQWSWATRLVISPAGGTFEEVLKSAVTPNSDDCSKVQTTCAGLPADIWPPLESELVGNGNPTGTPFEQSWRYWLSLAKDAATEADRLGEELLEQGLRMDLRREESEEKLLELCGASPEACESIGLGEDPADALVWVTLGDKPACLWKVGDKLCDHETVDKAVPCPIVLGANEDGSQCKASSEARFPQLVGKGVEYVATTKLGLVPSTDGSVSSGACAAFARLRDSSSPWLDAQDSSAASIKREEYIRQYIFGEMSQEEVKTLAHSLRYKEEFGDNYVLAVGDGNAIFDTRRAAPGQANNTAIAPCTVSDADASTGASFWTRKVECFVSGLNGTCPDGVGKDGCPGQHAGQSDVSMDTEPNALRARWSWGFGHLRRSVATLGVITGELNDTMALARVVPYSNFVINYPSADSYLTGNPDAHSPYAPSTEPQEAVWLRRSKSSKYQSMRCVELLSSNAAGIGSDAKRSSSGRPINANAFIPAWLPTIDFLQSPDSASSSLVLTGFPTSCVGANCVAGVDPQFNYCEMPPPSQIGLPAGDVTQAGATWPDPSPLGPQKSTGYIGASYAYPGRVRNFDGTWLKRVKEMWTDPGADFCSTTSDGVTGAVYRAFCYAPGSALDDGTLPSDPEFMRFGRLKNHPKGTGNVDADESTVGAWVGPIPNNKTAAKYGQMLFDLRKGSPAYSAVPFQYPLTQRNIFDALELACHVRARGTATTSVSCDTIDPKNLPLTNDLSQFAGILDCLAKQVQQSAERYTAGPLSKALVEHFANKEAFDSTSGLGGKYLETVNRQHAALTRVGSDYGKIRDATSQLAVAMRKLKKIADQKNALDEAAQAQALATMLQTYAQAAFAIAQSSSGDPVKASAGAPAAAVGISALFAAAGASVAAIQAQNKASDAEIEQKRLDVLSSMITNVGFAREAADDFVLALNDLTLATADQAVALKQAAKALAGMGFNDFALNPDGSKDPQYVNVVMRRMFNTKLLRYEKAFERAKRLSYLARRAIELRFGVDMQHMDEAMTLVDAPSHWVNQVCDLQGIDYAKIRTPNPDAPVSGWDGGSPIPGDDFSSSFVGDYVKKLEDFTSSYPIDYPLHDGDDTGVISLADDVFNVSASCAKPGRNLLLYSTELDGGEANADAPDTEGWVVRGCGLDLPSTDAGPGGPWTGCVGLAQMPLLPVAADADGGAPEGGTPDGGVFLGLERTDLPDGAIPYRVRHEPCVPGVGPTGEPIVCPTTTQYSATGSVAQYLTGLAEGTYVASVYALPDPASTTGGGPEIRVVRVSDGHVESKALTLDTASPPKWKRTELPFLVQSGETYRLELVASSTSVTLDAPPTSGPPNWPSVYLASVQVEKALLDVNGIPGPAQTWVRTDSTRDVVDPVCHELRGPALRKLFTRRCEYVCADGIKKDCAAIDKDSLPTKCFYEANFAIKLEDIEAGRIIPSGQIAIGNFNFRHNLAGINAVGTGLASCEGKPSSCYYNGFLEYTLIHDGNTIIRNYTGGSLPAKLDRAFVEHGKMLAAERTITNPPSSSDTALMEPYMKHEYKGRPLHGQYTIRIWDRPGLRWDKLEDLQLVWKYHYWTRFQK